ncbi:DUF7344 domain-containing protein [Halorientalis regularis]|jgi:hypothetical protein|uniref:DUF7344 domain-containing protein n=1 Tax=Halorientalis regularis TaxID=660518 RepID=A0A1G7SU60_9EURY|nr:hypothetical protein [Halorientalis regularis]SDG26422.1 hypothetical protein SAMN05216218_12025 [Halorientalis regularis]
MASNAPGGTSATDAVTVRQWFVRIGVTALVLGVIVGFSIALSQYVPWEAAALTSVIVGLLGVGIPIYYRLDGVSLPESAPNERTQEPLSRVLSVLANERRRRALSVLETADGGDLSMDRLAGRIAAAENDTPVTDLADEDRRRVYVSLYQTHVPRLEQMGAVAFDDGRGTIRLTERGRALVDQMELLGEQLRERLALESADELNRLFHTLRNTRRRYTLHYLRNAGDGAVDLETLADQVAAWEQDCEPEDLTKSQRKRVYVGLFETHLNVLAEAGLVEWNPEAGEVCLTDTGEAASTHLSLVEAREDFPLDDVQWARRR